MRLKKISIKNIGLIEDSVILVEKPLILFYGEVRQGKTTYLNAVKWACGAEFPEDIIRHGAKEASIELDFDGGMVSRSWYRNKENVVTARAVMFVRDGKPVKNPSYELKRLMNPFLLDQDYLRNMGETERKKYFSTEFACDTTELDTEQFNASRDAQSLRAEIKGYGEIDLTPAERVDAATMRAELGRIKQKHQEDVQAWRIDCDALREKHQGMLNAALAERAAVTERHRLRTDGQERVQSIDAEIETLKTKRAEIVKWLENHPALMLPPAPEGITLPAEPTAPDTAALEARISDAAAANVRADQFDKDKARAAERDAKQAKLEALEKRQRAIKAEKIAKLKTVTDTCGIAGLAFNEEGEFTYNGTAAGMLSTSEIMKLSSELSALAPDGIGVQLLDRGESLGVSIFEYVDQAKRDEVTILATIVGTKPANIPEDIGVFVVKNGKAMK